MTWGCAASFLLLTLCSADVPLARPEQLHAAERAVVIDEVNSKPGLLWKAGANPRFAGMPLGSVKPLCGVKPGGKERLRARVEAGTMGKIMKKAGVAVPDHFDSATQWPKCAKVISDIRDQSNCGCCWAFGAAEAASDRLCIASNATVSLPLSAQETCFCAQANGCDGGQLETAWDYIASNGLATGNQYNNTGPFASLGLCSQFSLPHCHHHGPQGKDPYPAENSAGCPSVHESPACPAKCDGTASSPFNDFKKHRYTFTGQPMNVDSDVDAIKQEIMKNGPVEAAFTVFSDFENYISGIYSPTSSQSVGGHAIKIVGWGVEKGTKYWKVQNSWNPYWGEKGYFRMKEGECGIEDQVVTNSGYWAGPGLAPAPAPPPAKQGTCARQTTRPACAETKEGDELCQWCLPMPAAPMYICQKGACIPGTDVVV